MHKSSFIDLVISHRRWRMFSLDAVKLNPVCFETMFCPWTFNTSVQSDSTGQISLYAVQIQFLCHQIIQIQLLVAHFSTSTFAWLSFCLLSFGGWEGSTPLKGSGSCDYCRVVSLLNCLSRITVKEGLFLLFSRLEQKVHYWPKFVVWLIRRAEATAAHQNTFRFSHCVLKQQATSLSAERPSLPACLFL